MKKQSEKCGQIFAQAKQAATHPPDIYQIRSTSLWPDAAAALPLATEHQTPFSTLVGKTCVEGNKHGKCGCWLEWKTFFSTLGSIACVVLKVPSMQTFFGH